MHLSVIVEKCVALKTHIHRIHQWYEESPVGIIPVVHKAHPCQASMTKFCKSFRNEEI